jgi:hypothetical protein
MRKVSRLQEPKVLREFGIVFNKFLEPKSKPAEFNVSDLDETLDELQEEMNYCMEIGITPTANAIFRIYDLQNILAAIVWYEGNTIVYATSREDAKRGILAFSSIARTYIPSKN